MLYILHGPNDFARNEYVAQIRASVEDPSLVDLNLTVLDGKDSNLGEIRSHVDAMPFIAAKRVVIVSEFIVSLQGRPEAVTALVDYLGQIPLTTDFVLVETETLPKNHSVLKAAAEVGGEVVSFGELSSQELRPWIKQRAKSLQAEIEPDAVELLARLVGPHLRTLTNELEKLVLYVGDQRSIEKADVELLVPYTEDAESFGFANAIGQRNARRAYDQMRKLLDEGKHPMSILGSIAAQIRGLLEVKDMAERGLSPPEIARLKGWRSDYAAKMRLREAANFSIARLEQILEMLLNIDLQIKTGKVESLLALDMLIARLCGASR